MSTLELPEVIPSGKTPSARELDQEVWEIFARAVPHRPKYHLVTSDMISESHESHSLSGFRQRRTGVGPHKLVIPPPGKKFSHRWQGFAPHDDVWFSSGTTDTQTWAVLLRPCPPDINLSFISVAYVGSSSSVGVEGLDRNRVELTSIPEAQRVSPLAQMIGAVYKRTSLDEDVAKEAERAVADARAFANREIPEEKPLVMVSDDGLVMLQWRDESSGVLLIFTGDGTGSYSVKPSGGSYTANNLEFSLADGLPAIVKSEIKRITST